FSRNQLPQRRLVELSLREQALELLVLLLKRPQTLRVRHVHAAELRLPSINRRLGHPVAARQIGHRCTRLVLLQNRNDLLFLVTLALHLGTSLGSNDKEIPHRAWLGSASVTHSMSTNASL